MQDRLIPTTALGHPRGKSRTSLADFSGGANGPADNTDMTCRTSAARGEQGGVRCSLERTLLIGTPRSVRHLQQILDLAEQTPSVIGCLLPPGVADSEEAGVPVLGTIDELEAKLGALNVEQALVSLPLNMNALLREVGEVLDRAGVTWRFMPTLADQLAGRVGPRGVSGGAGAIDPTQLIARTPHPLDTQAIRACLRGRRVMITGAGGSIGSELARLVASFEPAELMLVERSENAVFQIDQEIGRSFPGLRRSAILHDVTHRAGTLELCEQRRPNVIFHAAAHKHVPMMEDHPSQAVENNFFGTRSIADAALACGAARFVMISSDKAVNPSSVMGATKRLAELYVQHLSEQAAGRTIYSMVRFGNVLGSACSVLPIWAEQLAHGGPITVTHPEMSRYFMTIPEAAGLVLQAGALSEGGEVFLLDMGDPVRIVDLAERFCRTQGFEPGVDVQISFTGVRPGEKLFEELAYGGEDMLPTPHESIRIWRTPGVDRASMQQIVGTFERLRARSGDSSHPWQGVSRESILAALRSAIPEMVAAAAG